VDDALPVGRGQPGGELGRDPQHRRQADRAVEEGKEPVTDVFAIHGGGLRCFDSIANSDHRHCRRACRGAAAGTVNYVAAE